MVCQLRARAVMHVDGLVLPVNLDRIGPHRLISGDRDVEKLNAPASSPGRTDSATFSPGLSCSSSSCTFAISIVISTSFVGHFCDLFVIQFNAQTRAGGHGQASVFVKRQGEVGVPPVPEAAGREGQAR
jgi:hypothetical protein